MLLIVLFYFINESFFGMIVYFLTAGRALSFGLAQKKQKPKACILSWLEASECQWRQ
jgi:hypothetical protein